MKELIGSTYILKENMKTQKTAIAQAINEQMPNSLKQFGVIQSGQVVQGKKLAQWFMNTYPDFPKGFQKGDDELKQELYEGYMTTYSNLDGGRVREYGFVEVNGSKHFVEVTPDMTTKPKAIEKIGVYYAMSLSSQAFGAMANTEPDKYAIVKSYRTGFQKFASNSFKKLLANIREIENEGKAKEHRVNKLFFNRVSDLLNDLVKSVKVCEQRSDETANADAHNQAMQAYITTYKRVAKIK